MAQEKSRYSTFINLFIDPFVNLPEKPRKRARSFSSLILSGLVASLVVIILFHLLDAETHPRPLLIETGLSISLFGIYLVSRTRAYAASLYLASGVMTASCFALASPAFGSQVNFLVLLIIPIIWLTRLHQPRTTIYFMLLNLFGITLLPSLYNDITYDIDVFWAFTMVALGGLLLIITDVLSARKTRGSDQEITQRLTMMLEASPQLIAIYRDEHFLYLNPTGQKLLEIADYLQEPIEKFGLGADQLTDKIRKIPLQDGFAVQVEQNLTTATGRSISMQITSMPVLVEGELAIQIIGTDLTERNSFQKNLAEIQTHNSIFTDIISAYLYEYSFSPDEEAYYLTRVEGNFEKTTGYKPEQTEHWDTLEKLVYPEDKLIYKQHIQGIRQGRTSTMEYRITTANNTLMWVCDYGHPRRDANGLVNGVSGVIQDISERIEPEAALKSHALQQAVVAELGQHALRYPEREEIFLEETVTLAAQVLDCEYCIFHELNKNDQLVAKAWTGWNDIDATRPVDPKTDMYRSHAAYTFSQREPVVISDVRQDKRLKPGFLNSTEAITSGIGLPIHGQVQTLGTLLIHSSAKRHFSVDDINFLQAIANILGGFIEQRHIRAEEAEQRILAEALKDIAASLNSTLKLDKVMDKVMENVYRVVPHDAASIMLIEGRSARIIRQSGFHRYPGAAESVENAVVTISGHDLVSKMLQTHQSVFIPDVHNDEHWVLIEGGEWIRAYVGAPILFEDEVIGILNVDSATAGAFSQEHAQRLQAFADQAAIAIRNAQLTDQLEQIVNERTRALNTERNTLRSVLDATGEGIFHTTDTTIVYANPTFCRMMGYTQDELLGKSTAFLIGRDSLDTELLQQWNAARQVLLNGQPLRGEQHLVRKDGSTFEAAVTMSLIQSDGDAVNIVVIARDISEEKALDEQKTRFIANASHELRSPISSMNTRLYLLNRDRDNVDKHIELMGRILERMNRLVEDLLDMSRFENGVIQLKKRDVILQNIITDVVEQFDAEAKASQISLDYAMPSHPIHAFVDPDRIVQVVTNLVNNAIRYTDAKGQIKVKLTSARDNGASYAMIFIEDTGIGIPQEQLQQIFQPFYRGENKVHGTGLGLSIAREIALLHNGEIMVESVPGKGSTFCVKLPEHINSL